MSVDDDYEWVTLEEALERIMQVKNCSRRTARRLLAKDIKAKRLEAEWRTGPPKFRDLSPKEAAKRWDTGAEMFFTLDRFMAYFKLTWEETLGELCAGRLIAGSDESTAMRMELGQPINPRDIAISIDAVEEWLNNPATPSDLIMRKVVERLAQ